MVWLCFPGMTSSLANHRCTLSYVFSTIFLFLTFHNIHIYFIILKTYDQQFTLTTKKSLHIIFNEKCHSVTLFAYYILFGVDVVRCARTRCRWHGFRAVWVTVGTVKRPSVDVVTFLFMTLRRWNWCSWSSLSSSDIVLHTASANTYLRMLVCSWTYSQATTTVVSLQLTSTDNSQGS